MLAIRFQVLAGRSPQVEGIQGRIRIAVELPARLPAAQQESLLIALADADRYGHEVTAEGACVWAEIDRDPSETEPRQGG